MPELPEIETVKLQLQKHLVGQTLTSIEQLHPKSLFGKKALVEGKKVTGIKRLGKMLVIDLEGEMDIAIHFKMSGQLILVHGSSFRPKADHALRDKVQSEAENIKNRIVGGHPTEDWLKPLPTKHTRVIFHFKSGDTMYFNDQRIFGWVKIMTQAALKDMDFVKKLGPELWDISNQDFYELIHKKKKAIKVAIMEQDLISGVGNIYANDGLWEAQIYPQTPASSLTLTQAKALRAGLIKVLKEGIKYGGATAADAKYIDLHGLGGTYQEHFRTYDREGKPCLRCKTLVKKTTLGGRGTYFCPQCQI